MAKKRESFEQLKAKENRKKALRKQRMALFMAFVFAFTGLAGAIASCGEPTQVLEPPAKVEQSEKPSETEEVTTKAEEESEALEESESESLEETSEAEESEEAEEEAQKSEKGQISLVSEEADQLATDAESEYPLEITDTDGGVVRIESEPMKVVSLGPDMSELIYALGASDKLVGRTDYCDYPAEISEVTAVGGIMDPDIEAITALEPDLILASTHVQDDVRAKLDELDLTVLYLYNSEEISSLKAKIIKTGLALNKNKEAKALADEVFERIAAVQEKTAEIDEKPTVYYVVGFGESGDYSAAPSTFIGQLIEIAGGNNIVSDEDGWSYSVEKLMEVQPEIIVIPAWADGMFQTTEPYSELDAVKNDKVFVIDNNMLDRQGPRNADGVEALAEIFHPEIFK